MKYATVLVGALAGMLLPKVLATAVTLYQFEKEPTASLELLIQSAVSLSITPVAVEKSGATVYVAVEAAPSEVVYTSRLQPVTITPTQTTETYTFKADATHYHLSAETVVDGLSGHREDDCTFASDGRLDCKVRIVAGDGQKTINRVASNIFPAKPWHTISNVQNLQLPTTAGSSSGSSNGAGVEAVATVVWMLPTMGVLAGVFLL